MIQRWTSAETCLVHDIKSHRRRNMREFTPTRSALFSKRTFFVSHAHVLYLHFLCICVVLLCVVCLKWRGDVVYDGTVYWALYRMHTKTLMWRNCAGSCLSVSGKFFVSRNKWAGISFILQTLVISLSIHWEDTLLRRTQRNFVYSITWAIAHVKCPPDIRKCLWRRHKALRHQQSCKRNAVLTTTENTECCKVSDAHLISWAYLHNRFF